MILDIVYAFMTALFQSSPPLFEVSIAVLNTVIIRYGIDKGTERHHSWLGRSYAYDGGIQEYVEAKKGEFVFQLLNL